MKRFVMSLVLAVLLGLFVYPNTVTLSNVKFGVEPLPASQKVLRDSVVVINNPNASTVYFTLKFYRQTNLTTPFLTYQNIPLPAFCSDFHSLLEGDSFSWGGLHGYDDAPIPPSIPWDTYSDGFRGFRGKIEVVGESGVTIRAYCYTNGTYDYLYDIQGDPREPIENEITAVYANYYQLLFSHYVPAMEPNVVCLPWIDCWPPNPSIAHPGWDFKVTLQNDDLENTCTVKIKFIKHYGDVPSITQWQTLAVIPHATSRPDPRGIEEYILVPAKVTVSLKDYLCGSTLNVAAGVVFLKPETIDPSFFTIYKHWAHSLD
jgi:hypothetical protein